VPSLGRGLVLTLLFAIGVFAALSVAGDVRALGQSLAHFHVPALVLALSLVLGNYALRFLRWQYYLRTLGVSVDNPLSLLVFLAGFVMSVTPGKMGEVFKSFLLHEYRGISISRTASAVVAERLLDLVALVFLVSLAGFLFPSGLVVAGLGGLLVLVIVLLCTVRPLGELLLARLPKGGPIGRLTPRLREAYGALQELTRVGPFTVGAVYATLGWSMECLATWCVISGFGQRDMGLSGASFSYAAGTLAGALAMLPGGLGVAELGMSSLFRVADPNMSLATAAAATILVRLCTLWFGVALGGFSLLLLRVSADKSIVEREK
jgi:uncharacterized membrane protein YbhN (UPF0104 family)